MEGNGSVLIAGAGIAGPTLAFWLKAAGFEPTLLERAAAPRSGGYVVDFWGLGYDIAERMGLTGDIHRLGYHARELRIVDDRGRRTAGFGTKVLTELTGGRYVTIGRSDLSQLLLDKVRDTTEVLFGDEIIGLEERADAVRVQLKGNGERQFGLVIGADGLHSGIRRLAFGPLDQFETPLGYVVAAFEAQGYRPRDDDVYVMYGQPGRMLGRFALRDDRTLFLFVFTSDEPSPPETTDRQKAMLRRAYRGGNWECAPALDALDRAHDLYFDRVSQIRMKRWSRGRIALVGDAAFCVSLMAGQGAALAMISAYVLAGELCRAGGRYEQAFERYEGLLRGYIATKQRGADRFASAFAPRTQWGLCFRNLIVSSFAIPGLAKIVVGKEIIDSLRLPDYPWQLSTPAVATGPQQTDALSAS